MLLNCFITTHEGKNAENADKHKINNLTKVRPLCALALTPDMLVN
uniref:Uncharacterized protein n=1 Tax=Arundo donax TaxID=35708 RepID=A0A0A8YJ88_ARUDO